MVKKERRSVEHTIALIADLEAKIERKARKKPRTRRPPRKGRTKRARR